MTLWVGELLVVILEKESSFVESKFAPVMAFLFPCRYNKKLMLVVRNTSKLGEHQQLVNFKYKLTNQAKPAGAKPNI